MGVRTQKQKRNELVETQRDSKIILTYPGDPFFGDNGLKNKSVARTRIYDNFPWLSICISNLKKYGIFKSHMW